MPVHVRVAIVALHEVVDDPRPETHADELRRFVTELAENRDIELQVKGAIESRLQGADALVVASVHGSRPWHVPDLILNPWIMGFDAMRPLPAHVFLLGWQEMNRFARSASAFLQMHLPSTVCVLQEPYPIHVCRVLHEQGVFRDAAIASGPW